MDSYRSVGIGECFIGETKYKAGIFLSIKIAEGKPYYKHLKLEAYSDFQTAESEFLRRYREKLSEEIIRLNRLYEVRERPLYSVFCTPLCVGMTCSEYALENFCIILKGYRGPVWWKHALDYEEAARRVWLKLHRKGCGSVAKGMSGIQLHTAYFFNQS